MPNFIKTTMRLVILSFITFTLFACRQSNNSQSDQILQTDSLTNNAKLKTDLTFEKVEGSKIVFKDSSTFETNLFELEYIGQVPVDNKAPFLIFSGRDCNECDANISIYIHSPSDGQLKVDHGENRYQYPGTEKDYETDSLLYMSRAFYGEVLENIKGVIWYEYRLLQNGQMGRFVFLSQIKNGIKKDTVYEDDGKLGKTVMLKKKGQCKEIKGREYTSEP